MFQKFGLRYYCRKYCMEVLYFCIKIGINSHQIEVNKRIYLFNFNYNG